MEVEEQLPVGVWMYDMVVAMERLWGMEPPLCASSLNQQDIPFVVGDGQGHLEWLEMVRVTSSASGQRLLVTVCFYCVNGFATSVVNCGTTRVLMLYLCKFHTSFVRLVCRITVQEPYMP
jgi:hypothetical protein